MKTLLKTLVLAVALGLVPAAATAQHNPNVSPQLTAGQKAQLPAQPAAVSPPQAADSANPSAADVAKKAIAPVNQTKPEAGIGMPDGRWGFQDQFTEIGRDALWFHDVLLVPIIIFISLFVLALMLYAIIRFRRAAHPIPSRTSHNTFIEIVWTLVPVLILVAIFLPSHSLLSKQFSFPKPDLTIKAIGHQWYWSYQYPDNGDFEIVSNVLSEEEDKKRGEPRLLGVDERMVVPAGATVKMIITSDDVVHSWGVPSFWVKLDAVPGRLNETWFKVDRPGLYYGQCFELCGIRHGFMPIAVEVLPPAQFAAWVASKGGTMGGPARSSDATANSPITNPAPATAGSANSDATTPPPPTVVPATATPPVTSQAAESTRGATQ